MRRVLVFALMFACSKGGSDDSSPPDTDPVTDCVTDNEECDVEEESGCRGDGDDMLPGADCMACHADGVEDGEARWTYGGTAFTDRYGTAGLAGATIRITDADGTVVEATTHASGNFYGRQPLVFPITAEIEVDGVVRSMADPVDDAGCNSCHSCEGEADGKLYGP